MPETATLLLVTHVAIRQGRHGLQIDDQTAAGIEQWCRHFDKVTYYGVAEEKTNAEAGSSAAWVDTTDGLPAHCTVLALPRAYRIGRMAKEYLQVRATMRKVVRATSVPLLHYRRFDWRLASARCIGIHSAKALLCSVD